MPHDEQNPNHDPQKVADLLFSNPNAREQLMSQIDEALKRGDTEAASAGIKALQIPPSSKTIAEQLKARTKSEQESIASPPTAAENLDTSVAEQLAKGVSPTQIGGFSGQPRLKRDGNKITQGGPAPVGGFQDTGSRLANLEQLAGTGPKSRKAVDTEFKTTAARASALRTIAGKAPKKEPVPVSPGFLSSIGSPNFDQFLQEEVATGRVSTAQVPSYLRVHQSRMALKGQPTSVKKALVLQQVAEELNLPPEVTQDLIRGIFARGTGATTTEDNVRKNMFAVADTEQFSNMTEEKQREALEKTANQFGFIISKRVPLQTNTSALDQILSLFGVGAPYNLEELILIKKSDVRAREAEDAEFPKEGR